MPDRTLTETNRRLCEKAGDLFEFQLGSFKDVKRKTEAAGNKATIYTAKVAHADKINGNERIYTRELFGAVISEAKKQIGDGQLAGACDHPGWDSGGLKDTCLMWKSVWMESDGAVMAEFSLIPGANHADHMQALIDAGAAIGFSTRGRGRAHYPDDAERARYGLPDDTNAVIIGLEDEYTLSKIDAVDDPSVFDAYRSRQNPPPASNQNSQDANLKERTEMKTLAELKTGNPDLFKQHEEAIKAAREEAVTAANTAAATVLEAEKAKLKTLGDAVTGFMATLAEKFGIVVVKELPQAAASDRIEALKTQVQQGTEALSAEKAKTAAAETKSAELQTKLDEAAGRETDSKRREAVTAKLPDLLKDNRFAKPLRVAVLGDGKDKKGLIADGKFDVAAAETFVKEKTAEYEAISEGKDPPLDIWGIKNPPENSGSGGSGDPVTVESVKKDLRL